MLTPESLRSWRAHSIVRPHSECAQLCERHSYCAATTRALQHTPYKRAVAASAECCSAHCTPSPSCRSTSRTRHTRSSSATLVHLAELVEGLQCSCAAPASCHCDGTMSTCIPLALCVLLLLLIGAPPLHYPSTCPLCLCRSPRALPAVLRAERWDPSQATSSTLSICSSCALPMVQAVSADVAAAQSHNSSTLWATSLVTLSFRTNQGSCGSYGGYLRGGNVSCSLNGSLPAALLAKYTLEPMAISDPQHDVIDLWLVQPLVDPGDLNGGQLALNIQYAAVALCQNSVRWNWNGRSWALSCAMCCVQVYVELGPVAECRRARAARAGAQREQRVVQLVERLLRSGCEQHERDARCRHERGRRGRCVLSSEHGARHFEYGCVLLLDALSSCTNTTCSVA